MKKINCTMPASVLASVLVVCTLVSIGILLIIGLFDNHLHSGAMSCYRLQQEANIASAFVKYCRDSTLNVLLQETDTVCLFEEDRSSVVRYRRMRWGLYEVVEVSAGEGKWNSSRLLGKKHESDYRANLYFPDNGKVLSLSGDSFLEGRICLSGKKIVYNQLRSDFFTGTPVTEEQFFPGGRDFPLPDPETAEVIRQLLTVSGEEEFSTSKAEVRSFKEPLLVVKVGTELSGADLRGHILVHSDVNVTVDKSNCLRHIVLIAPSVKIASGFHGDIQVFASDSIVLEDNVRLEAGSGLWVGGENPERLICLGKNCEINGYIIVNGNPSIPEKYAPHYKQPGQSRVRGLVYVDGCADIHGIVSGSLYAREACYFSPEGYYAGQLYRLAVLQNPEVAYPMLMAGPYERREVRWLD